MVQSSCTGTEDPIQKTKQYTTAKQRLVMEGSAMVIPSVYRYTRTQPNICLIFRLSHYPLDLQKLPRRNSSAWTTGNSEALHRWAPFYETAVFFPLVLAVVCEKTNGEQANRDGVYYVSPKSASKFTVSVFISYQQYKYVLDFMTKYWKECRNVYRNVA